MYPAKGVKFCESFATLEIKRLHITIYTLIEKWGTLGVLSLCFYAALLLLLSGAFKQ